MMKNVDLFIYIKFFIELTCLLFNSSSQCHYLLLEVSAIIPNGWIYIKAKIILPHLPIIKSAIYLQSHFSDYRQNEL